MGLCVLSFLEERKQRRQAGSGSPRSPTNLTTALYQPLL